VWDQLPRIIPASWPHRPGLRPWSSPHCWIQRWWCDRLLDRCRFG